MKQLSSYRACSKYYTKSVKIISKATISHITRVNIIMYSPYLAAAACIISTAQHAKPNVMGHNEP